MILPPINSNKLSRVIINNQTISPVQDPNQVKTQWTVEMNCLSTPINMTPAFSVTTFKKFKVKHSTTKVDKSVQLIKEVLKRLILVAWWEILASNVGFKVERLAELKGINCQRKLSRNHLSLAKVGVIAKRDKWMTEEQWQQIWQIVWSKTQFSIVITSTSTVIFQTLTTKTKKPTTTQSNLPSKPRP